MTPKDALAKYKRDLVQAKERIIKDIIYKINKILVREIHTLTEGKPQTFEMEKFTSLTLYNPSDVRLYKQHITTMTEDILKHYNKNKWKAEMLKKEPMTISIEVK